MTFDPVLANQLVLAARTAADAWLAKATTSRHGSRESCANDQFPGLPVANEGARELGYADTGVLWRSWYDMPPVLRPGFETPG
jgi:hypothetical protein